SHCFLLFHRCASFSVFHSFPTRRSSDLAISAGRRVLLLPRREKFILFSRRIYPIWLKIFYGLLPGVLELSFISWLTKDKNMLLKKKTGNSLKAQRAAAQTCVLMDG